MQKQRVEVLAPAGSMDSLKAAVAAGCSAVYLGGTLFSARAFAGNFDHEEMAEAVRYCHIRGVSVYVTMNTLLFEKEFANALKEVRFLYENDVDALLVQDLGLFHYLRTCYPEFPVHCSTQMHIHNKAGVRFMKDMGASKVVLARETPLQLIRECVREGIDIEAFAYGALCVSYSGQCLMSESLKNRSGNRGMCAQCCRLRYSVDGSDDESFLLSMKDLNVLDRLPELLDTGVVSLKIEGRMKRPEYVYLVTKTFREAVDAWYEDREYKVSEERLRELKLLFHRGFTEGHVFGADASARMNTYRPNHLGIKIGEVTGWSRGSVTVKLSAPLYQHDGLRILSEPYDTGLTAVRIEKNGLLCDRADAGDIVKLSCKPASPLKKGLPLHKTSDAPLLERINREILQDGAKPAVSVSYRAEEGSPLMLEAKDEEGHCVRCESAQPCQKAKNAPLSKEKLEASLMKAGEEPYRITIGGGEIGNVFLPVSVINETRRQLLKELSGLRQRRYERSEPLPYSFSLPVKEGLPFGLVTISENSEPDLYPGELSVTKTGGPGHYRLMPAVNEKDMGEGVTENAVLSSVGDLCHPLKNVITGYTFNVTNHFAAAFLLSVSGVEGVILSSEMDNSRTKDLIDAFREEYGFEPPLYALVYGKRILMYIKDGVGLDPSVKAVRDIHGSRFGVSYENGVMELLEADPRRAENPFCRGSCILLTDESAGERQAIREEAYEELHERI